MSLSITKKLSPYSVRILLILYKNFCAIDSSVASRGTNNSRAKVYFALADNKLIHMEQLKMLNLNQFIIYVTDDGIKHIRQNFRMYLKELGIHYVMPMLKRGDKVLVKDELKLENFTIFPGEYSIEKCKSGIMTITDEKPSMSANLRTYDFQKNLQLKLDDNVNYNSDEEIDTRLGTRTLDQLNKYLDKVTQKPLAKLALADKIKNLPASKGRFIL